MITALVFLVLAVPAIIACVLVVRAIFSEDAVRDAPEPFAFPAPRIKWCPVCGLPERNKFGNYHDAWTSDHKFPRYHEHTELCMVDVYGTTHWNQFYCGYHEGDLER